MPVCHTCRTVKPKFVKAFIPLAYKGVVRKALLSMKFYDRSSYCRSFALLITDQIIKENFADFDFITYIPISKE